MNNRKSKEVRDRRKSIKILASGGAILAAGQLPKRWSKPVVESVMLPVHAQTSSTQTSTGGTGRIFSGSQDFADATRYKDDQALVKLMNTLVPAAQAEVQPGAVIELAVEVGEDNSYQFTLKATEFSICLAVDSGMFFNEFNSFHTGNGLLGETVLANGTDCANGSVTASLAVETNGGALQVSGTVQCLGNIEFLSFGFPLSPGGTIPSPSPCTDCVSV